MKQAPKQINYEHFSTKTVDNYVNNSIPSFNLPHRKKYLKKQKKIREEKEPRHSRLPYSDYTLDRQKQYKQYARDEVVYLSQTEDCLYFF